MDAELTGLIIEHRHRVPLPVQVPGNGAVVARQLDAALMSAGFKCSRELFGWLSRADTGQAIDLGGQIAAAARKIAGDHVRHSPYFRDFPFNVPATLEFWAGLLERALAGPHAAMVEGVFVQTEAGTAVLALNLLSLPGYGTVQHTYEDMLAAHDVLARAAGDRITVLHAGGSLREEAEALYLELAGSTVPLSEEDRVLLGALAEECIAGPQPDRIPVRENRAILNAAALRQGRMLLADTVTDVLRLAAHVCGADVSLETPARFRSLPRAQRRIVMASLETIVSQAPAKLGDVGRYREQWKRLGERIHPHEFGGCPHAQRVFAVARGEESVPSFAALTERSFRAGRPGQAARLLAQAPGLLFRSLDRMLRHGASPAEVSEVLRHAQLVAPSVSGRVLLSVREHFQNRSRIARSRTPRIFAGRSSHAWVRPEERPAIDPAVISDVLGIVDEVIASRLPATGLLVVDPDMLSVALPLSGKPAVPGIGVLPRGSVSPVIPAEHDVLRFFVYWREREQRTDYNLSALLLSADYTDADHVSWTSYHSEDAAVTYSGDITSAPDGATELIDVQLRKITRPVIIPQVNIYAGERFGEAAEAFFGFMLRGLDQRGLPFEATTVRMKSDLRGSGRVALPLAFLRGEDGNWRAKWLHLYLRGRPSMNVVEGNRLTTALLTRTVAERDYLQVRYLTGLWAGKTASGHVSEAGTAGELALALRDAPGPVTYIGLDHQEGLPEDAVAYTTRNLAALVPE